MVSMMRHLTTLVVTLSAFLISLVGFAQPITAGATVSLAVHPYYKQWKNFPDFRAFYAAGGLQGGLRKYSSWAFGRSAGQPNVKSAEYGAKSRCERNRKKYDVVQACRLYALGDIVVAGMSGAEIGEVRARYEEAHRLANLLDRQGKAEHSPALAKRGQGEDRPVSRQRSSIEGR